LNPSKEHLLRLRQLNARISRLQSLPDNSGSGQMGLDHLPCGYDSAQRRGKHPGMQYVSHCYLSS
jgi:hypothetical protein